MKNAFRLPARFEIARPDPFQQAKYWVIYACLAILVFGLGALANHCASNNASRPMIRQLEDGSMPPDVDEEIEARAQGKLMMIQGVLYIKDNIIWEQRNIANLRPGATYTIYSYVMDGKLGRGLAGDSEGNFFFLEWQPGAINPPANNPKHFTVVAQNHIELAALK